MGASGRFGEGEQRPMSIKGLGREPTAGVAGSKPRLRAPKVPRQKETPETVALGEEYLRKRNKILDLRWKREGMQLAVDREQLIARELVIKQLSYMFISMRGKLLAIPGKLSSR